MFSTVATERARENRSKRFAALEWCRENIRRKGQRSCMFAREAFVSIAGTASGAAHVTGVKRCASPWSCPVCAPTIAERRAQEIDGAVSRWIAGGGSVWMVTATLSHQHGDDLAALLDTLQEAWSRTWRWEAPYVSRRDGRITNRYRVRPAWYGGQIRTVEITHGFNGFHPHIHSLVFVPAGFKGNQAGWLMAQRHRWAESVAKFGGTTDVTKHSRLRSIGWQLAPVTTSGDVARYLTKVEGGWSAGKEIAKADQKRKGVTPWMLLRQAVDGDQASAATFAIYERATRGLRRIVASPGLCRMVEDEEAAEAQLDEPAVVEVHINRRYWRQLLVTRQAAGLLSDVTDLATGRTVEWRWPANWLRSQPIRTAA